MKVLTVRSLAIVILPLMINQVMSLKHSGISLTIVFSGSREGELYVHALATDKDLATYVCVLPVC